MGQGQIQGVDRLHRDQSHRHHVRVLQIMRTGARTMTGFHRMPSEPSPSWPPWVWPRLSRGCCIPASRWWICGFSRIEISRWGPSPIACFAVLLYGSAVILPQLAQQHLGYTALLAGLVMSPGALAVIFLIPVLSLVMPARADAFHRHRRVHRARELHALLAPNCAEHRFHASGVDTHRAIAGIGFLFVPLSVLTLPDRVASTAGRRDRAVHDVPQRRGLRGHLRLHCHDHVADPGAHGLSVLSHDERQFEFSRHHHAALERDSTPRSTAAASAQSALGQTYQTLIAQAGLLAYKDVFLYCALLAFGFVPFTFFFSPVKKAGGPGAAH